MVTLTPAEMKEIHEYLSEYMHTEEAQSMKDFCQHGAVSTYDHVMNVVRLSYYLNKRFRLGADTKSLVTGSFLHDFYLYDWHEDGDGSHRLHGFTHPQRALANACQPLHPQRKGAGHYPSAYVAAHPAGGSFLPGITDRLPVR